MSGLRLSDELFNFCANGKHILLNDPKMKEVMSKLTEKETNLLEEGTADMLAKNIYKNGSIHFKS